MAIALTVVHVERGSRRRRVITYTPAFSGTYATNGDTIDFTAAASKLGATNQYPSEAPTNILVQGAGGFDFEKVIGTLNNNSKLKVFSNPNAISEIPFSAADLKGATAPAGTEENADQAAGPVNAALIMANQTFTTMAGTVFTAGAATHQPDLGRNIIIVYDNTTGGALNAFQGVTTFTVTGKFRGAAQVELITITSSAGNKAIAASKFRYKAGVKPFDSITSITYDNAGDGTLSVSVAPGSKIGLPANSATSADADFIKVMNTAADYAVAGKVDYTNWALDFGTTADNWDFLVEYKPLAGELPNGIAYPAALIAAQANIEIVATFRGL